MSTLSLLLDPFLSLLYPPRCLLCRTLGAACLCDACARQIAPVPESLCARCGLGLSPEGGGCHHCALRRPAFDRARAMGAYEGVLRAAVHQFKYRDRPQMAEPLGLLLADHARAQSVALHDLRFDALLPVPMHPIRRRLRGYNQSERLARVLARDLGLPLEVKSLIRTRATRPQVGLTGDARRHNLRGAFAVPRPAKVAGRTLLLVDDVVTTGSTLSECAAILKAAGAKAVYALTLAAG
ncbi:MAG: ComF family protein [Armatimonadetes bacterium]|nr:ComF family protein [Armatimonadota bacterium]